MKDYIKRILSQIPEKLSGQGIRIWLFEFVRDIPYGYSNNTPEETVTQKMGDCRSKSHLLAELLATQKIKSRSLIAKYKLPDFPEEVNFIPNQCDYHHAVEFLINGKWILVDPTYDPAIAELNFVINTWDGINPTMMCFTPLIIKKEGEVNSEFDRCKEALDKRLESACNKYPRELHAYRLKFNEILSKTRASQQRVSVDEQGIERNVLTV